MYRAFQRNGWLVTLETRRVPGYLNELHTIVVEGPDSMVPLMKAIELPYGEWRIIRDCAIFPATSVTVDAALAEVLRSPLATVERLKARLLACPSRSTRLLRG